MIMSQEIGLLKAKEEFQKIEETIRQATIQGTQIDVVEENLWDRMLGLGRLLLTSFVAGHGTGDLGPALEYQGRILNRLAQLHNKPYMSVFGALPDIERTVYGTRETQKHELIPLDARLGLPESDYSYLLQQWSQSFCVKGSYKDAQTDLKQILRLRPSIRVLEDMNGSMSKDVGGFRSSQPTPSTDQEGEIMVVTADCKGVRIRGDKLSEEEKEEPGNHDQTPQADAGNHARKRGPRPGTKREACVGSAYSIDRFVRTTEDVVDDVIRKQRAQDRPIPQNKVLRAELTHEVDGVEINGKDVIFDWLGEEIKARQTSQSQEIVCVMDGATTLWKKVQRLMKTLGVTIVCILDLFHVMDYLWDAARCVHGSDDKAAEAFVTDRLRRILAGDVGRVIGGLRQMLAKDKKKHKDQRQFNSSQRKTLNRVIGYFDRKKKFMRYDEYMAKGYPIGSGVVEGACGHLVKDRMEGSGMRWSVPGAQSMLDLRCVYLNEDWTDFHDYRIKERVRNMYPYRDLVQQQYRATG
ncbi:MAG: ISKra4 family transposase [Proteobacteria bacterium]|nr:ISKra4 family transposase [Pseudomonadota bacterium]